MYCQVGDPGAEIIALSARKLHKPADRRRHQLEVLHILQRSSMWKLPDRASCLDMLSFEQRPYGQFPNHYRLLSASQKETALPSVLYLVESLLSPTTEQDAFHQCPFMAGLQI